MAARGMDFLIDLEVRACGSRTWTRTVRAMFGWVTPPFVFVDQPAEDLLPFDPRVCRHAGSIAGESQRVGWSLTQGTVRSIVPDGGMTCPDGFPARTASKGHLPDRSRSDLQPLGDFTKDRSTKTCLKIEDGRNRGSLALLRDDAP